MDNSIINNSGKNSNLTDKAFMHSITVSVISILFCLIALCSATFAWFNQEIKSTDNSIKSGNCTVTVIVTEAGNESAVLTPDSNGTYKLLGGTEYNISISAVGTVKSSYCLFLISTDEYYTEQISTSEPENKISFTLKFANTTDIEIITRWGTYHISNDARAFYDGKSYIDLVEYAG